MRPFSAHWLRCGPRERSNTLCDTLEKVKKAAKVNTLADLLDEENVETLAYTLTDLEREALINTIAERLVKVKVKELAKELTSCVPRR